MTIKYYYILMSQKQMLENEVLEEILRERATYYFSKKKCIDFWVTISPEFVKDLSLNEKIKNTNFYKQKESEINYNSIRNFYSVLISSDKEFIKWISLRLGYFENIADHIKQDTKSTYISDGIQGIVEGNANEKLWFSPLKSNKNFLHPDILLKKYKKALEIYYLKI